MSRPTLVLHHHFRIRGCHPLWPNFPKNVLLVEMNALAWSRFARQLLRESLLMSFPPGTECLQFPGFASTKPILFSSVIPYATSPRLPEGKMEKMGE